MMLLRDMGYLGGGQTGQGNAATEEGAAAFFWIYVYKFYWHNQATKWEINES